MSVRSKVSQIPFISPDYANQEAVNRFAGVSSWTTDRDGFVQLGGFIKNAAANAGYWHVLAFLIDEKNIYYWGEDLSNASHGVEMLTVVPIKKGQTVSWVKGSPSTTASIACYFIPPKVSYLSVDGGGVNLTSYKDNLYQLHRITTSVKGVA